MKKHGLSDTPEYFIWSAMKRRCSNPNVREYKWYGARGISVCDRWRSDFAAFISDMGPRPVGAQIDRTDNNKGYNPDNCSWVNSKQQGNNTRSNHVVEYGGLLLTISQWSDRLGIPEARITARLNKLGMTAEEALKAVKMRGDGSRSAQDIFEHNGEKLTLGEWAVRTGIRYGTIWQRMKRGYTFKDSISLSYKELRQSGLARRKLI